MWFKSSFCFVWIYFAGVTHIHRNHKYNPWLFIMSYSLFITVSLQLSYFNTINLQLFLFFYFYSSSVFMSMASGGKGPSPSSHKHTNRLASERSPYLLQHAHNPVDWWVTLHWRFSNVYKICMQSHAMFSVGIRGDKRLLTKRRMKISQSFYQVRCHSFT